MDRKLALVTEASRLFETLTYKWMGISASESYTDRLSRAAYRAEVRRDRRTLKVLFAA